MEGLHYPSHIPYELSKYCKIDGFHSIRLLQYSIDGPQIYCFARPRPSVIPSKQVTAPSFLHYYGVGLNVANNKNREAVQDKTSTKCG